MCSWMDCSDTSAHATWPRALVSAQACAVLTTSALGVSHIGLNTTHWCTRGDVSRLVDHCREPSGHDPSLQDIADAIAQMHEKARYRRLLLFVETCEAETLTDRVYSPNVLTIATSKLGARASTFE